MEITDPGERYQYLKIEVGGQTLNVFKDCRVKIYDAFWVTEPISEDEKPNIIMSASDVPFELWDILTQEEKLLSALTEERRKTARLERDKQNWLVATLLLGALSFALVVGLFYR